MTRLFVYGSLLRGENNHSVLEGARCLGDARTTGALHDLGAYPALVLAEGRVVGEVYEIGDQLLAKLDAFEEGYTRVTIALDDGTRAETYTMDEATGPLVPSGDWRAHTLRR